MKQEFEAAPLPFSLNVVFDREGRPIKVYWKQDTTLIEGVGFKMINSTGRKPLFEGSLFDGDKLFN